MKRYRVRGTVTISVFTDVEAEDEIAAKEVAAEHMPMSFCYQCSVGQPAEEWVTSGELDGEVEILDAELRAPRTTHPLHKKEKHG